VPVYDLTYRRANLPRRKEGALGAVLQQSVRYGFRSRWTKGIFIACWLPALVFCSMIYIRNGFAGRMQGRDVNAFVLGLREYHVFFQFEQIWLLVLACAVGAGLLADDRRANALELLFARPLGRLEYLAGKFGALALILFAVTGFPAIVVWLFDVLVAPDWSRLRETWDWPLRFLAFGGVLATATASVVLALSAIASRGLYAAVYFAVVYLVSVPLSMLLSHLAGEPALRALGFLHAINSVGKELFGLFHSRSDPPFAPSLVVLLGASAACALVAWVRTRPSEVVR
jgi:ABC-2 type transport system permease protein